MKQQSIRSRVWVALSISAIGLAVGGWSWRAAVAQTAPAEPAAAPAQAPAAAAAAPARDMFNIPAGEAAALEEFIKKIDETATEGQSPEARLAHAKKVLATIAEASTRMLAAKPDEEQAVRARSYRLRAWLALGQMGDKAAAKEFADALEATLADPRPEIASIGWNVYLGEHLSNWDGLEDKDKEAFLAKISERIHRPEISPLEISIVQMAALNLDHRDMVALAKLLDDSVPVFQKSESKDVKEMLAETIIEGMQRRLTMLGQPMEVFGELLGGGEIDWKSYRGKVVLIDFSATTCPPCMAELPNVQKLYNAYKDQGFDVIAVSLDETADAAKKLVADRDIKWATLFSSKEDQTGPNNPLAKHYGVVGIPTAILVDKDGKVVHMEAREDMLRSELERLLGKPAAKTPG